MAGFAGGLAGGAVVSIIIRAVDEFSDTMSKAGQATEGLAIAGAAITGAGIASAAAIAGLAKSASNARSVADAFTNLVGDDAPFALDRLKEAVRGTMSEFELMQLANEGLIRGLDKDLLPSFFESAYAIAQARGLPVAEVIDNITRGVALQSEKLLKSAGVMVDIQTALGDYALALGRVDEAGKPMIESLTEQERAAAITEATLASLKTTVAGIGPVTDGAAEAMSRANAQFADAKVKLGEALAPAVTSVLDKLTGLVEKFNSLDPSVQSTIASFALWGTGIALVVGPLLLLLGALPGIVTGVGLLSTGVGALAAALWPVAPFILAAVAAAAIAKAGFDKWGMAAGGLTGTLKAFGNNVAIISNRIKLGALEMANSVIGFFEGMVNGAISAINGLIRAYNRIAGKLKMGKIGEIGNVSLGRIDTGGINAELDRLYAEQFRLATGGTSAGGNIVVNIDNVNGMDPKQLSQALRDSLGDLMPT